MGVKEYEEEYVASLEAEVQALQKERRLLETRVQDLLAELERTHEVRKEPAAP
jgi:hypothetical protein